MRIAGMISAILVLIAVALGLYSLKAAFGFETGQFFGLLWPVAAGVVVLAVGLLAFGRWSARMLNKSSAEEREQD